MSVWSMFVYNTYTLTHSFLVSKQIEHNQRVCLTLFGENIWTVGSL